MKTARVLPSEEIAIIKQIVLVPDSRIFSNGIGHLVYIRKSAPNYWFKELSEEHNGQELYPNDELDDIVLQSIRNYYSKSFVRNHFLFYDTDTDYLSMLTNKLKVRSSIRFMPSIPPHIDITKFIGQTFECLDMGVNIYTDLSAKEVENIAFFGYYKLEDNNILQRIETEVTFL